MPNQEHQTYEQREPFTPRPAPELDKLLQLAGVVNGANATTDTGFSVEANPLALRELSEARQKAVEAIQNQPPSQR